MPRMFCQQILPRRFASGLLAAFIGLNIFTFVPARHVALAGDQPADKAELFPLGQSLRVLERDLTSKEYLEVLATMIPTDLAAEWKRVATADNHEIFLQKHGGKDKVLADPEMKAAHERRVKIAGDFLQLMRDAYQKRKLMAPFDQGEKIDLLAAGAKAAGEGLQENAVRVVMPAPGAEKQWPRFRGPTGQGTAIDVAFPPTWSDTENVIWNVEIGGAGNSSPIIWGDRLFITAADEAGVERSLICYDRRTGSQIWKQVAPKPASAEKLYWKNSYASSTPVTDGERVVCLFGNSGLVCFDMDGKQLWQQDVGTFAITHGPGASPVLYKGKVIVVQDQNQGESLCAAYNKLNGERVWQQKRDKAVGWATPVVLHVGDHDELIYNGSFKVLAYNPDTGEELWRVSGSSNEAVPTIVIGGGLIYSLSGRNGPMLGIRPGGKGDCTATHIEWQVPRGGPHVPSPAYYDGRLYLINDTGIASCLDAKTGETVWQTRLRGRFSTSPVEAAGKLLATNEAGLTFVFEAGPEFKLLAENDLHIDTLASPALLGGRLYFRTKTHLLCIGEKEPAAK